MGHSYFYRQESEQFAFYRIPKALFTDDRYRELSAEAKILYGILLDKVSLSLKNQWIDGEGRVYIIYTTEQIMEAMGCGNKKAAKLTRELEDTAGLIEKKRRGLCKPSLIYVKNFVFDDSEDPKRHFRKCQNDISGDVEMTLQEVSERHATNTDINNTDYNDTESIVSDDAIDATNADCKEDEENDRDKRRAYEEYFRKSIELDALLTDRTLDREILLGIYDILADTCSGNRNTIRIGGEDKPIEVVRSKFMKLDSDHVRYVMECMDQNTTKIRNIRQYILAALYNAPSTIGAYYTAQVRHDWSEEWIGGDED